MVKGHSWKKTQEVLLLMCNEWPTLVYRDLEDQGREVHGCGSFPTTFPNIIAVGWLIGPNQGIRWFLP